MASMKTISRLFAAEPPRKPVKTDTVAESPPEPDPLEVYRQSMRPVRRQFGSRRDRLDSPAMMSSMYPSVPLDRGDDLRALAMRETAAVTAHAWLARRIERGGAAGHPQAWMHVQI